jgi:hypothetical protein
MTLPYRLLANSLPRCGPFLLASALDLVGYCKFVGNDHTPRALNYQEAKNALQKVAPAANLAETIGVSLFAPLFAPPTLVHQWLTAVTAGEYMMGHMPYSAPLQSVMASLDYRHLVILRDPRALLLALLFQDQLMPRFLAADFALLTPMQQVEKMWDGGYLPKANVTLQPFAAVYRSMLAWRGAPNCLEIRFEDLVGPQADGSIAQQQQALTQLAAFLDLPVDDALLARVDQIADPSAHTFSLAQRATWSQCVASEVVEYVEDNCVTLCQEAGYIVN